MELTEQEIKSRLDVALLSPTATPAEIDSLASVLRSERFAFLCVNSLGVKRAAEALAGSPVHVVACVGFPHGTVKTRTKVFETEQCIEDGAHEIDMVLCLGALFAGDLATAREDVRAVVRAAAGRPVKVIIETPYLSSAQKVAASRVAQDAGAAFVKTCTGTSPDPIALYEDIRLIRQTVGPAMGIKASGRVGSYFRFLSVLEAGANRVGLILPQAREILRGWAEEQAAGSVRP